jgi:ABC-type Fe3+/spermidine/putrescine transport system ATPase subunit
MNFISFDRVTKHYGQKPVLADFSLDIQEGDRVVIFGHSGCGKTTVLRLLAGFITPDQGTIVLDGKMVAKDGRSLIDPEERHVGMVFQDLALWPHLMVRGNLEFGLKARGIDKPEREERISVILRMLEMADYVSAKPAELSGGQRQRVALARALVLHPKILLMDEPFSSLDFELNLRLRKELLKIHGQIGFTLIYVTHSFEEAADLASYIVLMKNGQITMVGEVDEIKRYFQELSK